jgi:hypothetical protein
MDVFHGTNISSATNIVGPPVNVNVALGGGELGRGFYLGESIALAAAWSKGKYGRVSAVIKFEIDDSAYIKLNTKVLSRRQLVFRLFQSLMRRRLTNAHLFNVDVVCAPFATMDLSYQYKFESKRAETTLNNNSTLQIL